MTLTIETYSSQVKQAKQSPTSLDQHGQMTAQDSMSSPSKAHSPSVSPTEAQLRAAEELELGEDVPEHIPGSTAQAVSAAKAATTPHRSSPLQPSSDSFRSIPASSSSASVVNSPSPPGANTTDPTPDNIDAALADESTFNKPNLDRFSDILLSDTVDPTETVGLRTPSGPSTNTSGNTTPSRNLLSTRSVSSSGSGWRSTMSNLLTAGRSASGSQPTPPANHPSSPNLSTRADPIATQGESSTSFLLRQVDSPGVARRHRISREMGGSKKLAEGFERVRLEMEDVAREMRREESRQDSLDEATVLPGGVDWNFWGAVVQDYEEVARTRPKELSKAIQQGIPPVIRGAIWQLMSSSKDAPLEETYKALLKLSSPHEKAIVKDLSRTMPSHQFYKEGGGVGQESLFMVVKAYSLFDQEVGYTQGLAFIVAALLLNMPDEEAFCVLVRLMDSYNLRSHFLADMPGLQLRLFQFDRLLEELLPLLHSHFVKKGVKSSMFASQWFMTLFSYRFPLSLVYRVLDIVFAEGIEAIFRFSLALLRKSEDKLVTLEFEHILAYLQAELFEVYRAEGSVSPTEPNHVDSTVSEDEEWRANEFVRDAYEIRITPFMLDNYENEYQERCREENRHAHEIDQLRNANRSLSNQVKQLESSLSTMNTEHVELVRQLVMSKIEKEETENELIRYKMLYAELAHAQQDALSQQGRRSAASSLH